MQWSITIIIPTLWITVELFHQLLGHIQPAMVARVVEDSLTILNFGYASYTRVLPGYKDFSHS